MKTKLRNQKGFTIIEVLIVLAIAGLILLIVFLAVPALQRNSRNTQRKNDIAGLLGAVSEYASSKNGALPVTTTDITNNTKMGYYVPTSVSYTVNGGAVAPAGPAAGDLDTVEIHTFSKCNATGDASSTTGATARGYVALYRVETGSGDLPICQEG